ncbi:MAG: 50S ribosomal protein L9 [Patescibacteria group bacterium]
MHIILLTDVKKVGQKGSVVDVADGYAQNVLIPKKLAVPATATSLKQAARRESRAADKRTMDETLARKALADIDGKTVILKARANDAGGLFEAVRAKHIAEAVRASLNVPIPDEAFELAEPLKKLGAYEISVRLNDAKARVYLQLVS